MNLLHEALPTEMRPNGRSAKRPEPTRRARKAVTLPSSDDPGPSGRTKVIIMGSDSPLLPPDHIRELLRSDADVALGPTKDGGYYAICCRRAVAEMFDGVPWSTGAALAGTVDALTRCGLTVEQGPGWFDVDTPDDLERLMQRLGKPPLSSRAIELLDAISIAPNFLLDPQDLDGLAAYLHKTQLIPDERVISAERIGDGNMNLTVRLRTSSRTLILKQARPWVEKYPHIPAPVERASVEAAFYRVIGAAPDLSRRMPRLLGFDYPAKLLILEDLGERSDLMGLYREDRLPEAACLQLVEFLSMLHACAVPAREAPALRNLAMRKLNHEHQYDLPLRKDMVSILTGLPQVLSSKRSGCGPMSNIARASRNWEASI